MSHAQSQYSVSKLYQTVIDDVVQGTRESFLDEGVDEQIQQELRMLWESKLLATKAVEADSLGAAANGKSKTGDKSSGSKDKQGTNSTTSSSQSNPMSGAQQHVISTDPSTLVPIQITMPRGPNDPVRNITIQVPAACIHTNKLQDILSLPTIQATLTLPADMAASSLQGQVNQALINAGFPPGGKSNVTRSVPQLDGPGGDSSSDDDDDDDEENEDDDVDDKDDEDEEQQEEEEAQDEEPLNSGDDVSDNEESTEKLYEIDNVIVCQYDKITRTRNKWKFHLKDGIMNLNGKDYVFQKANGDAEW